MSAQAAQNRDQITPHFGSRRGALAAFLAGVAGAQSARADRKNRGGQKKRKHGNRKGKGKNNQNNGGPGLGSSPLPLVTYVVKAIDITGKEGVITGGADCPVGFVAINGEVEILSMVVGVVSSFPAEDGTGWNVAVNLPAGSQATTLNVFAVCLQAELQ